ncbi:hypothetical protein ACHWQZ_G017849 [Mnemiopsis leidyi]
MVDPPPRQPAPPIENAPPKQQNASKQKILFITDSVLISTPEFLFNKVNNHRCIKTRNFYMTDIPKYESEFKHCSMVLFSMATEEKKKGKRNVLPVQESDSDANIAEMLPKGKQSKRVKVEQHPVTVKKTTNGKRKALSVQESDSESDTEFLEMLSKRKNRIIDSIYSDENNDEDNMTPDLAVPKII